MCYLPARVCLHACRSRFEYCIHSCEQISVCVSHALSYLLLGLLITAVYKRCKASHCLTNDFVLRVGEVNYDALVCSSRLDTHKTVLQRIHQSFTLTANGQQLRITSAQT